MTFEWTKDRDLIRGVLCRPDIYPYLHDDLACSPDKWEPVDDLSVAYYAIYDEAHALLGIAIVAFHCQYQVELHNAILPHVGRNKRIATCREFFTLLQANGIRRVIGKVPSYNRYAAAFNVDIGMEIFGVNKNSFLHDGQLIDEIWFGLSLPQGSN